MDWIQHESVYYLSSGKKGRKIAAFDLDDTLIERKTSEIRDGVVKVLRSLRECGYIVVVFTNQKITKKSENIDDLLERFGKIVDKLHIDHFFMATRDDVFRKPHTGMFTLFLKLTQIRNPHQDSFYCGDACGRKGDFSSSDLYFAHNTELAFFTPEMTFDGEPFVKMDVSRIKYPTLKFGRPKKIEVDPTDIVMLIGPPSCGKSTITRSICKDGNHEVVSLDISKTKAKMMTRYKQLLSTGCGIVIDNTNASVDARREFIELAKGRRIVGIMIDIELDQAKHLGRFRVEITRCKPIPAVAYNVYKSRFEKPRKREGFTKIIKYPLILDTELSPRQMFFRYVL